MYYAKCSSISIVKKSSFVHTHIRTFYLISRTITLIHFKYDIRRQHSHFDGTKRAQRAERTGGVFFAHGQVNQLTVPVVAITWTGLTKIYLYWVSKYPRNTPSFVYLANDYLKCGPKFSLGVVRFLTPVARQMNPFGLFDNFEQLHQYFVTCRFLDTSQNMTV